MDNESQKILVDALMIDSIQRAVTHYGIEKTEEIILSVYSKNSIIQRKMLSVYNKLYKTNL